MRFDQSYNRQPAFGTTEWRARQIESILEREEQEKAELRRLRDMRWRPALAKTPAARRRDPRFGDGREALVDPVRRDREERDAFHDEARRRAGLRMGLDALRRRPPTDPLNRCLDACAAGERTWERFCRSLREPRLRAACWALEFAGEAACRNWCLWKFRKE